MPLFFRSTALTPLLFRFNAVNADFFSVQRRQHGYFSRSTRLTPLFFQFIDVNAAISPAQRCQPRYFSGFKAVNSDMFAIQRR